MGLPFSRLATGREVVGQQMAVVVEGKMGAVERLVVGTLAVAAVVGKLAARVVVGAEIERLAELVEQLVVALVAAEVVVVATGAVAWH